MTKPKPINKLNITVSGTADSGKSHILYLIGSILSAHGFNVNIASKDYQVNILPKDRLKYLSELNDKGTVIKLETKQTKKELNDL